ncbi:YhcN/YlaJ family sporulation lipoprotein [Bacillus piscicola]|uniref:YhcN/YlaJ family sporulation lipoprotein n=1 Tax=Bacillus piscicola TaxID=1632684 RepID=UPI001F097A5A|nr:YhcN/YlaJ family sporulation lipoprotein [Bacillus piscicola]
MKKAPHLLATILIMVVTAACMDEQRDQGDSSSGLTTVHMQEPFDQSPSIQTKKALMASKEITDVKAVNTDEVILVGIKLDQFARFKIKSLEKKIKNDLKQMHPDKKVNASADYKIYLEVGKLEEKNQQEPLERKNWQQRIQQIKELAEEKT